MAVNARPSAPRKRTDCTAPNPGLNVPSMSPVATSQNTTRPSDVPAATRPPPGAIATAKIAAPTGPHAACSRPVAASNTRTHPSNVPAISRVPSPENAISKALGTSAVTAFVPPPAMSHTRTWPSASAAATRMPEAAMSAARAAIPGNRRTTSIEGTA